MLEYLSPREYDDVQRAEIEECGWAQVLRCFLDGPRLLLGWDQARSEDEIARLAGIAPADAREAIDEASRWCVVRKLHLLGWQEEDGSRRHFMAVG
ncbi:MAG TPA: hypothetical protein VGV60_14760 [Candidatus Polarisedimenticolia bacterium]|nr:hypothetical protein [Candidatus Polarisedimenticolia bacterium]